MASSSDDEVEMKTVTAWAKTSETNTAPEGGKISPQGPMPTTLKDVLSQARAEYKYSKFNEAKSFVRRVVPAGIGTRHARALHHGVVLHHGLVNGWQVESLVRAMGQTIFSSLTLSRLGISLPTSGPSSSGLACRGH